MYRISYIEFQHDTIYIELNFEFRYRQIKQRETQRQRDRYKWTVRGTKEIIFEAIEADRQTDKIKEIIFEAIEADRQDKRNREDSFVFEREIIV